MGQTQAQVESELDEHLGTNGNKPPTTEELSSNFYWTFGKENVFHIQTTVRGAIGMGQVKQHFDGLMHAMKAVLAAGGHAKNVGKPDLTPNATAPTPPNGAPVPPAPTASPAAPAGPSESACAMIEIGTSYQGGKTQLKFHVNGMEHPLSYTKEIGDMVKLLAPLGFTAAHIVVGQKYPVNCIVTWVQQEKYRNVMSVRKAA